MLLPNGNVANLELVLLSPTTTKIVIAFTKESTKQNQWLIVEQHDQVLLPLSCRFLFVIKDDKHQSPPILSSSAANIASDHKVGWRIMHRKNTNIRSNEQSGGKKHRHTKQQVYVLKLNNIPSSVYHLVILLLFHM